MASVSFCPVSEQHVEKRFLVCDKYDISDVLSHSNIKRWTSGTPGILDDRSNGFLSAAMTVYKANTRYALLQEGREQDHRGLAYD
ncbi:hypothetical protein CSPX01_11054 [Colletotrichum filicis]|nr:hypothetical protein CSPX01_11054 [Colletotrichum filicis]